MQMSDINREIMVRLGSDTTEGYYTDSLLELWADQSHRWAASYKRWPFTEGKVTTTFVSSPEAKAYPEGWRSDSIRILQIGSDVNYRLQKLNFEDYQLFREENSSSSDRVFSDFAGEYYINPNVDLSGSTTLWGQYTPATLSSDTVFTGREEEGNEAIIQKMLSYAAMRDKRLNDAITFGQSAMLVLDNVWKRITDEQYAYQTKNRGMFERFDVLNGVNNDEIAKRDQFI